MENIINFYCPKFQKWNFIKNPWYTKIQHCTTLIFLKKLDFCDFFLRKFLLTVLHIFHRKYTPNFQKIDFSIYPNILYICDQNFMLVPTIKLLEFSDKNWETYERILIFWSIFWLFFLLSKVSKMKFYQKSLIYKNTTLYDIDFPQKIGFLRFFLRKFLLTVLHIIYGKILLIFIVQSFKNEISSKILDTQKYNIVRHWFSSKNWIFAIFFKKVSIDGFTHYLWKILLIFIVQSFKNEISSKILDTQKYNIVRHWFSSKNWIFSIFLRKFLLTVLHIFHRKYTPNLSIFWLFFLLSKVWKMKFHQKSLMHKNTTLYDIDFPQ